MVERTTEGVDKWGAQTWEWKWCRSGNRGRSTNAKEEEKWGRWTGDTDTYVVCFSLLSPLFLLSFSFFALPVRILPLDSPLERDATSLILPPLHNWLWRWWPVWSISLSTLLSLYSNFFTFLSAFFLFLLHTFIFYFYSFFFILIVRDKNIDELWHQHFWINCGIVVYVYMNMIENNFLIMGGVIWF